MHLKPCSKVETEFHEPRQFLQVVTVLANMAGSAQCRPDIRAVDGVPFLLSMLETRADSGELTQAETAAAERVQKKAAIALSRYGVYFNADFIIWWLLLE